MGLKEIYLGLEDRYYDLIDALHLGKMIDPIDKIIPSFALVLLLFLALLGIGGYYAYTQYVTPPISTQTEYTLSLTFKGPNAEPISGATATITFADQKNQTKTTSTQGKMSIKVKQNQSPITVALEAEGYQPFSQSFPVTKNESTVINLLSLELPVATLNKTIIIQDAGGVRLGQTVPASIVIKFSCSSNSNSTPTDITSTTGNVAVSYESDCGTIVARVIAQGFEEKTTSLIDNVTTVRLTATPSVNATTQISIAVKRDNNSAISGAQVRLYKVPTSGTEQLESQGLTDSSGTFLFPTLNPGRYYVSATKVGFTTRQTPTTQLNVGQSLSLSLALSTSTNNKKFLLRIQNAQNIPIPQAEVLLFFKTTANRYILQDTEFSDTNGRVSNSVGDVNDVSAAAVINHPNYLTKIVDPITLVGQSDTTPFVVVMESLTPGSNGIPSNAGYAEVKVSNEVQAPISSATTKLFSEDVNGILIGTISTNASGMALYKNLPANPYQATATKNNFSGISAISTVSNGQKKVIPITLVAGQGAMEVEVKDALTQTPISDANVTFRNFSTNEIITTVSTDSSGKAIAAFDGNRTVYAVVQKSGYTTLTTVQASIIAGNITTITVFLQSSSAGNALNMELLYVRNSTYQLVNSLQPNQTYWMEFRLTIPEGAASPVKTHIRTGSETGTTENLNQSQDVINIQGIESVFGVTQMSAVLDPNDFFAVIQSVSTDAKLSNTTYTNRPAGQYQFFSRVKIKNTAVNGQIVKIRYQGIDNSTLQTNEYIRTFTLGQPLQQNTYGFTFFIRKVGEPNATQLVEGQNFPLIRNNVYQLDYSIANFSDTNYNASTNPQVQFSQTPTSIELGLNNNPSSTSSITVPFTSLTSNGNFFWGQTASGTIYLQPTSLSLNTGNIAIELISPPFTGSFAQRSRTLPFSVAAEGTITVNVSPTNLVPGVITNVNIGVAAAATGLPIQEATISIYLNDLQSTPITFSPTFNSNGLTVVPLGPYNAGDTIYIMVDAPDYAPNTISLPVGTGSGTGSTQFGCVTISSAQLNLVDGGAATFSITTTNCPQSVQVSLHGQSSSVGSATIELPTVDPTSNNALTNFTLTASDSRTIKVLSHSQNILGQFPVYVDVRFANQSNYTLLSEVKAIVSGATSDCFALNPPSSNSPLLEYTLSTPTSTVPASITGNITQNCYAAVSDVTQPWFTSNEITLPAFQSNSATNPLNLYSPVGMQYDATISLSTTSAPSQGSSGTSAVGDADKWMEKFTPLSGRTRYNFVNDTTTNLQSDPLDDSGNGTWEFTTWYYNPTPVTVNAVVTANAHHADIFLDNATTPFVTYPTQSTATTTLPSGVHKLRVSMLDNVGGDYVNVSFNGQALSQVVQKMAMSPTSLGGTATGISTNQWLYTSNTTFTPQTVNDVINLYPAANTGQGEWLWETFYYLDQAKPITIAIRGNKQAFAYLDNSSGTAAGNYLVYDYIGTSNDWTTASITLPAGIHRLYLRLLDNGSFNNNSSLTESLEFKFIENSQDKILSQIVDQMRAYPDQFAFGGFTPPTGPPSTILSTISSGSGAVLPINSNLPTLLGTLSSNYMSILNNGIIESGISNPSAFQASMNITGNNQLYAFMRQNQVMGQYMGSGTVGTITNPPTNPAGISFTLQANGYLGEKYVLVDAEDYTRAQGMNAIDLVLVVDTSPSMQSKLSSFCTFITNMRSQWVQLGYNVPVKLYGLGSTPTGYTLPTSCNTFASASFTGSNWPVATAYDSAVDSYNEGWGPGMIYAMNEMQLQWSANAYRAVVLFTDNDPTGNADSATGNSYWRFNEYQTAQQARDAVNAQDATAFAFYGIPETNSMSLYTGTGANSMQNDVIEVINYFSNETGGFSQAYSTNLDVSFSTHLPNLLLRKIIGTATQPFSIKVIGQGSGSNYTQNDLCVGPNNQAGFTNAVAVPKIKLDWSFSGNVLGTNGHETCNYDNGNGVYCDGVQFLISLFRKLNRLQAIGGGPNPNLSEVPLIVNYKARLIRDGYTADLLNDFYEGYRQGGPLGNSEAWFTGTAAGNQINFSNYLIDSDRFSIDINTSTGNTTTLPNSGVYDIELELAWDDTPYNFFAPNGDLMANVIVHITPTTVQEPLDNPLYFIPFDGEVGYDMDSNMYAREGYGTDYAAPQEIPLNISNNEIIHSSTTTGSALNNFSASVLNTFDETNRINRGKVLLIDRSAGVPTFKYIPSIGTPISTRLEPVNNSIIKNFYSIKETIPSTNSYIYLTNPPNSGIEGLVKWKPFASTQTIPNPNNASSPFCADLTGALLLSSIQDRAASSWTSPTNYCTLNSNSITPAQAFGFSYQNQPNTGQMEFQTVFYVPRDKTYDFYEACIPPNSPHRFFTHSGQITNSVGLNYTSNVQKDITSLKKMIDLITSGDICVTGSAQQADFFWNHTRLLTALNGAYGAVGNFPLSNTCTVV